MKQNSFLHISIKIFLLTFVFVGIFQVGIYALTSLQDPQNTSETLIENKETNATRFQSAYSSQFWVIGVALSTRVGMVYSETRGENISLRYYNFNTLLPKTKAERRQAREKLLSENTLMVREYYNLSATDIIDALKTSSNRQRTLDSFVSQIELRRDNALKSIQSLENQKNIYVAELTRLSQEIEAEKNTLESEFNGRDTESTLKSSEKYFLLRNEYTEFFTDVVFINQYLRQYDFLNQYNAGIINTLKLNRQAIIDQSYVVIPNTGSEFLRPLELILDEANISQ